MTETSHVLAGRLENRARTLGTDPRSDPRMVSALGALAALDHPAGPAIAVGDGRDALLTFIADAEQAYEGLYAALMDGVEPIEGVSRETRTIEADGHDVTLHIHRPDHTAGPLPVIYEVHGGGMVVLSATNPLYAHWRDALAAAGALVVGVEFRNGGGVLGPHPFPAGLDDCVTGLRWVHANLAELGGTHIVITGDSGGGNLVLALAIRARREGWVDEIAGVYAQCPFILGTWDSPPADLTSLWENDGYLIDRGTLPLMVEVYDPGCKNVDDPTCWPSRASVKDVTGLPPHVISANEVDPLRDEALAYHRLLLQAGVSSAGRVNLGLCHSGELLFPASMPEVYANVVRDVIGFAHAVA